MRAKNPTRQQVLAVCTDEPGLRPVELAGKLDRGINATYLAVADLERSGLIRRDEKGRYHAVDVESTDGEARAD